MQQRAALLTWDIACQVIDNFGDIGVCWRLATQLAASGRQVRLWVDDASALTWMAPQGAAGVTLLPWDAAAPAATDVVIEAFGCALPPGLQAGLAQARPHQQPAWINLEYLSAEAYVERSHRLPSPVLTGPTTGLKRHFFYPGFTSRTGGLLREPDLAQRQAGFDRSAWLQQHAPDWRGERLLSLFCYEPPGLEALLRSLASDAQPSRLLVTPGRASAAVQALLRGDLASLSSGQKSLRITPLPWLNQVDFDHLLWACDLNFVRGEDSLVRAIWAAKPWVWQIYPQADEVHHSKLEALLTRLQLPASLQALHRIWNGSSAAPLPALDLPAWGAAARRCCDALLDQNDLCRQLIEFADQIVQKNG